MHEIGIARDLWAEIKKIAADKKLGKISGVAIVVGESAGIDAHLLEHSFKDHIFPGSFAEGAELALSVEKVKAKCSDCGREITGTELSALNCPSCKGMNMEITSGKDCYVKSVEGK
ncbi:MAG: hydrogenase maturation nickel metallochaperone HypA [Elusimicrobiota bacterium]